MVDLFENLSIRRKHTADAMDDFSVREMKNSLIEMYSEKAHFVYELLQNADDVKATYSKFILNKDGLIFIHNGTIPFSISNVETEDYDKAHGKLGHINSIVAISQSTKEWSKELYDDQNQNKIGKFGVGFKSVFQYTKSPEVYDDNYWFRIERFIIPIKMGKDHNSRKSGETLFYLPFNLKNDKIDPQKAYNDILSKLQKLVNPLLFLNNLQHITVQYSNIKNEYYKKLLSENAYGSILVKRIKAKDLEKKRYFILFSKRVEDPDNKQLNHFYSVGFLSVPNFNRVIATEKFNAYCYFNTKTVTGLKFIINAPFILTINREQIKEDNRWNKKLIQKITTLFTESLLYLRDNKFVDDDFFNVLPIDKKSFFADDGETPANVFSDIYVSTRKFLMSEEFLPVENGKKHISIDNAFLARNEDIYKLLTFPSTDNTKAIKILKRNPYAELVFQTVTEKNKIITEYVREQLNVPLINAENFASEINEEFLNVQQDKWFILFYSYLNKVAFLWRANDKDAILRKKPIIRIQDSGLRVIAPFDKNDNPQVCLPANTSSKLPLVKSNIVQNKDARRFLLDLGLTEPKVEHEIWQIVIPRYESEKEIDNKTLMEDFEKIYNYFYEAGQNERDKLLEKLVTLKFLLVCEADKESPVLQSPLKTFIKNSETLVYFEGFKKVYYLNSNKYLKISRRIGVKNFDRFLNDLGLYKFPRFNTIIQENPNLEDLESYSLDSRGNQHIIYHQEIIGLDNLLKVIKKNPSSSQNKSILLWKLLSKILRENTDEQLRDFFYSHHTYNFYGKKEEIVDSEIWKLLKKSQWIYNKEMELRKPIEISEEDIHSSYDKKYADKLIGQLGIKSKSIDKIFSELTPEDQTIYRIGKQLTNAGLTESDIPSIKKFINTLKRNEISNISKEDQKNVLDITSKTPTISAEIFKEAKRKTDLPTLKVFETLNNNPFEVDSDETVLPIANIENELNKKKEKYSNEIAELQKKQDQYECVLKSEEYSLSWFKALLELEYGVRENERLQRNPISARFGKVRLDETNENTLILEDTDFIPSGIEDNGSLKLTINYKNKSSKHILLEAVSPQKKLLKAKLLENSNIEISDLYDIDSAVIELKHADFIFENLKDSFIKFSEEPFLLKDNYNFKNNLPKDIKFIFGPPGTGKTTYLAREEIIPKVVNSQAKILVMTPTNKASDVITNKIIKETSHLESYNWLVRYGITKDPELEKSPTYCLTKNIERKVGEGLVFITTVARYTYDTFIFMDSKGREQLIPIKDFNWDYIVLDEASMINLASIIYILFYSKKKSFQLNNSGVKYIIGGDPFQLGPIIQIDQKNWKDANIYTMVGLSNTDSFIEPKTYPHNYEVINLEKQYRSIPQIGSIYSKYLYHNKLYHFRNKEERKTVKIDKLILGPITIIEFPVSKFDTIYKPRKIKGSPYHIYSAIFTVELTKFIAKNIHIPNEEFFRIGIICPYRVQQMVVDKLLSNSIRNSNIEIITGTVHSFQGDECEIVLNLFNPPTFVSSNKNIFLNNKNLINVAISRAKDHLILLFPQDPQNHIKVDDLEEIKTIKRIILSDNLTALNTTIYTSRDIENILFSSMNSIEKFSFPTSHQLINVYANPSSKYEIRYDDNAIDIQVRMEA